MLGQGVVEDTYSDSDSTYNSDSDDCSFTVITSSGSRFYHGGTGSSTFVNAPHFKNIQVGSGRITVIGGAAASGPSRERSQTSSQHSSSSSFCSRESLTDSKAPPSTNDLNYICNNIGKKWKKLARALGFSRAATETIEMDYATEGVYEMAWQTILKWRRKQAVDVKVCDLARILYDIGLEELASELPVC